MIITFVPAAYAPDYYEFDGEVVTGILDEEQYSYDLSVFPEGAEFIDSDWVQDIPMLRDVERVDGELYVKLAQRVGPGHWVEGEPLASDEYNPDSIHVILDDTKPFQGNPWVHLKSGRVPFERN